MLEGKRKLAEAIKSETGHWDDLLEIYGHCDEPGGTSDVSHDQKNTMGFLYETRHTTREDRGESADVVMEEATTDISAKVTLFIS
jgi:hypothetical protein